MKSLDPKRNRRLFTAITISLILITIVTILVISYKTHRFKENYLKNEPLTQRSTPINIPKDKIKKVVLKNGMTIIAFENKSVPKVLVQIAYNIGSAIEHPDERGLAHLIEHMIFKGTNKLSEGDIDAIGRKYGATMNAFTSKDVTSYYFEVNSNNWKHFLPILSDCMVNAKFDKEHLASEMKAVIAELKMYEDDYSRLIVKEASTLIFPSNHSYHYPIIGFKETLLNLSSEKLKIFYNKYYQPKHATLFIVGDMNLDETIELAKKEFENIPNRFNGSIDPLPLISQIPKLNQTTIFKQVEKPLLGFYWQIPGLIKKMHVEQQAVEYILGSGEGSRLYSKIVDEAKVATSIVVGSDTMMECSIFFILIEPIKGKEKECREIVIKELNEIIKKGITNKELNKIVKNERRSFFEKIQDKGEFVYEWMLSYFASNDEFEIFKGINKLLNLDSKTLQNYTSRFLNPSAMNQIQILQMPKNLAEEALKESHEEDSLDAKILTKHQRTSLKENGTFVNKMPPPSPMKFQYPKPDKVFSLKNGLKVVLHKKTDWPFIALNLKFKDANYFSYIKEGTALDTMMGMLPEASKGLNKKKIVEIFEQNGAAYNFGASGVSVNFLKETTSEILKHLFYILLNPTFPTDAFNKLKTMIQEDFLRNQDDPAYVASRMLRTIAYKGHPFGWDLTEMGKYLKNFSIKDIKSLYTENISPSHMILSLVGDFDIDTMEKDINSIFGSWTGNKYEEKPIPKYGNIDVEKIDKFMLRNQAVLLYGNRSEIDVYNKDYLTTQLLNIICFGSLGSRLYKLREETGLFYAAKAALAAGSNKYLGIDYVYTILSLDCLDNAEKAIFNMLKDVTTKEPLTQDELDSAKQLYLQDLIDASSTYNLLASKFCILETLNLGFDYYDKVLERINSMKLDEINSTAKKYIKPEKLSRIRVGRIGKK